MDDSWRTPIGSVVPRRRSTGQPRAEEGGGGLDPDDFRDVFGGPPRTVLLRHFSGGDLAGSSSSSSSPATSDFNRLHRFHQRPPSSFYEEVFRRQMPAGPREAETGRRLPDFTVPQGDGAGKTERFSDDIPFGRRRSRTRSRQSKSSSSSVLSWEEQDGGEPSGPRRPWIADDGALSSFASKLRPIAVPSRRSPTSPCRQISSRQAAAAAPRHGASLTGGNFFRRPYSPGETVLNVGMKIPPTEPGDKGDDESGSDCSAISSDYDIPMATIRPLAKSGKELVAMPGEEDEGAGGSYVIEIVARGKAAEERGSTAVEEAIAWAKERL